MERNTDVAQGVVADVSDGRDDKGRGTGVLQVVCYLVQLQDLEICFVERIKRGCEV